jgi:hypothetical protein
VAPKSKSAFIDKKKLYISYCCVGVLSGAPLDFEKQYFSVILLIVCPPWKIFLPPGLSD